jgi:LmbE family N-acetylglucosaminyl deacetylase
VIGLGALASQRILVLGAHTDDEFACAGTIAALRELGAAVAIVALSACEASLPEAIRGDRLLEREMHAAAAAIGNPVVEVLGFEVRELPARRQEVLDLFVDLRARIDPGVVFLPSSSDHHQDHATVAAEGLRAFARNGTTILGYEMPQNAGVERHAAYVALEPRHVDAKVAHAAAYASQAHRPYMDPAYIRGLARVRGVQAGAELAEAFEAVRLMVR